MKKVLLILFFAIYLAPGVFAQCEMFDFKEGTTWQWSYYNKKGKFSSKTVQKVEAYNKIESGFKVTLSVVNSDDKGEQMPPQSLDMTCKDGTIYYDMKKFIPEQYKEDSDAEMNFEITGDNLEIPVNVKSGDQLKDASVKVSMTPPDSPMNINMTINVFDRKVEGEETLSTPAGKFECTVISQSISTKVGITIKGESKEWYSPGVGVIKSETYHKGKMTGYSLLTEFKK